jgi:WD40 repeat protein
VSSLTFAPDRPTLAAGGDGTVTLWDMTDPARPRRLGEPLTGHAGRVSAVVIAPDGRTLASAGEDGTIIISDVSTPTGPQRLGEPLTEHASQASHSEWDHHGVSSVAFAPDGHTLASAGYDGQMILWEVTGSTGAHRHGKPFTGHSGYVTSAAFTPDSRLLATAGVDGTMIVWDMSDPAQPRRLGEPLTAPGGVYSVASGPDGHTMISSGAEGVTTWDMSDPARPQPHPQPRGEPRQAATLSAASYPDAQLAVGADQDGKLTVWDVADPNIRRESIPMADNEHATSATLAPNRPILAAATALTVEEHYADGNSTSFPANGTVTLWNVFDPAHPKRYEHPLSGNTDVVQSVIFARDGNTAATLSEDGLVILWDVRDPAQPKRIGQLRSTTTDRLTSAGLAPDGRTMATGSQDGIVILWDLTDPAQPERIGEPLTGHTNDVYLSFAPDGRTLATASNTGMYLWDLTDLNAIRGTALQHACASTGGIDQTEWARLVPGLPFENPC